MKKSIFVRVLRESDQTGEKTECVYVPPPTGFMMGLARHQWLKSYFKCECSIASRDYWDLLCKEHKEGVMVLVEDKGKFRELPACQE